MNHCDHECAAANDCVVGGIECDGCGWTFCAGELSRVGDRLLCERCERYERSIGDEEGGDGSAVREGKGGAS